MLALGLRTHGSEVDDLAGVSTRLLVIFGLTAVIHIVDTLSYSVRISGIRTKRLALSLSLFNIIALASRTANLVQAPLMGSIVDRAANTGTTASLPEAFRFVVLAATTGSVIGAALIPTFIGVFVWAIRYMDRNASVPRLLLRGASPQGLSLVRKSISVPRAGRIREILRGHSLPYSIIALQVLMTAIYTIGVLSANYAGALIPAYRSTTTQLSGLINGVATIMLALIIDPQAALITDQVLQEIRPSSDATNMVFLLVTGKILGTLLGQVLLFPAARLIVSVARLLG